MNLGEKALTALVTRVSASAAVQRNSIWDDRKDFSLSPPRAASFKQSPQSSRKSFVFSVSQSDALFAFTVNASQRMH
jgi:hypothetical protein